jgi:hypothetical protein
MPADTRAFPTPDELTSFFREVRHAGYPLDPRQLAAAQWILLSVHGSSAKSDASRLKTLLAPVFVTSPSQQVDFYRRFEVWLSHHSLIAPPKPDPKPPIDPNRRWRLIVGFALVVILGAGTCWTLNAGRSTGVVTSPEASKELPAGDGQFFFLPGSAKQK